MLYRIILSLFIICLPLTAQEKVEVAVFAGGCFWCMESPFEKINGVKEVISGYTGGKKENPTYEEVSSGLTGHLEAVQVYYDPKKISYIQLLEIFWRQIDPTDPEPAAGEELQDPEARVAEVEAVDSEAARKIDRRRAVIQSFWGMWSSLCVVRWLGWPGGYARTGPDRRRVGARDPRA